jgi:hypothetical protein
MLEKAFEENTSEIEKCEINDGFSEEGIIPLLHPGNRASNGFGVADHVNSILRSMDHESQLRSSTLI